MSTLPIVSGNPEEQAVYERMRSEGQSHKMAEMLATRSFPGLKTDTAFCAGIRKDTNVPKSYRDKAKKAGVTTDGKQYYRSLAEYPGDPRAWQDSRSGIEKLCRERGWGCDGRVEVSLPEQAPSDDRIAVADDIVREEVAAIAEKDPGAVSTKAKREQLVEDTRVRLNGNDG